MSERQVDQITELRERLEEKENLIKAMEAGNMHPILAGRFNKLMHPLLMQKK
jgi:ribosome-binding protein aMBF1 (putative translation factor)